MNPAESLNLCRLAKALSPAQAVDDYTPEAWAMVLEDVRYVDAVEALKLLGREQEWIHVSHIVQRVKRIRSERIRDFGPLPEPPSGMDDADYSSWLRDLLRRIADGEHVERPALPAPGDVGRHRNAIAELIDGKVQVHANRVTTRGGTDE